MTSETGSEIESRAILTRSEGELVLLSEAGDLDRNSGSRDGVLERLDMVLRCRPVNVIDPLVH